MNVEEILKAVNYLLQTFGNVELETAKTWLEVREYAEALKAEAEAAIEENENE